MTYIALLYLAKPVEDYSGVMLYVELSVLCQLNFICLWKIVATMTAQIGLERLSGLIAFARTASLGSYTQAARTLSVSPSAISKSVQKLEDHLGVKLFSRTTRSLMLTSEGQDLYERALRVLDEIEEIEQMAVAARSEPSGILKVTAPLPIGTSILAPALPIFRERYPKIKIDLRLGDHLKDIVQEGIDVAIRVGNIVDSRLISYPLASHRICAFASPNYLAKHGTPLKPKDLARHQCVNFRYQSSGQALRWPFQIDEQISEVSVEAGIIIDVSDAVAAVLVAGGGIGISPTYVAAPYVERGELVPVLKDYTVDRFPITALWSQSRRGNPKVKAFVSFLEEIFPSPTPWDEVIRTFS
jgi:DNA-binding transcriptional LysR family regulator